MEVPILHTEQIHDISSKTYIGVDYGFGTVNINVKTGIRYGIIPFNKVDYFWDSANPYYEVCCPYCGNLLKQGFNAKICPSCKNKFKDYDFEGVEPLAWNYKKDGYVLYNQADDPDIWVIKSPFYTKCKFCSPCAPGAGDLMAPIETGVKTYCLDADWFDNQKSPYPVFSVKTRRQI